MITIREIQLTDAEQFLTLTKQLDMETDFMILEPGERTTTIEQQEDRIRTALEEENETIFIAQTNRRLVGYIAGLGGLYQRNQHKADVVIGILLEFSGQGLGIKMFTTLEKWARDRGLHKLELTVMAHNERAIKLYTKMGFVVEGVSVDSLWVTGRYVDELDMGKILDPK